MIIYSERLEMFRDLKIRKSEICGDNADLSNTKSDTGQPVQILPKHIVELLKKYRSKEISEEHLLEWVNMVWFTDLFEYCDGCYDCLASIMDELEESDDGGKELDDSKIEEYIQALLSIDDVAANEKSKPESKLYIKDHLLSIIIGIQVLYAAIKILIYLSYVVGTDLSVLINPYSIYVLSLYGCIIFFGINFFREKPFAWYGVSSSFLYLFYKNLIGFIILGSVLIFRDKIASFYKLPMPTLKMNANIIQMAIELCFSVFVVRLLLKTDTLDRLNIKIRSKLILIMITTGIVIVASALYMGIGVLLLKQIAHYPLSI